jgi:putative methionine-R-sulfoxide reductase with GAF domain
VTEPVALESIQGAFRGVIPSAFATCAADGTPNVTYMSIVHYVDSDRVGLSRQFFNKTRANLDENPRGQVRVVHPETWREYLLDLEYVHTETHGPVFEAMSANVEAAAAQSGMSGVFRLRGVDVHRVLRCEHVDGTGRVRAPTAARNVLAQLDELTRRLALCTEYGDATRVALEALDDLFAFAHSILLVRDADRLLAVASNGYPSSAAGAEAAIGEGAVGVAARTRQIVSVPNVARSRVMDAAVGAANDGTAQVPLPGLATAQSLAAVPLLAESEVVGVLYLESADLGSFGAHNERLLRVVGAHLAAVFRALDPAAPAAAEPEAPGRDVAGETLTVAYYQADDSVFAGDEYVVKGVPGRILWKLLREHDASGRETFTNRELRLDEALGLPAGNDNLEARLLVLRKRLAGGGYGIALERSGRGRLRLSVERPLELVEVETSGPMRAAHTG